MGRMFLRFCLMCALFSGGLSILPVLAQDGGVQSPAALPQPQEQGGAGPDGAVVSEGGEGMRDEDVARPAHMPIDPNQLPSLLFTYWEYTAIHDARSARGVTRAPTDSELRNDEDSLEFRQKPPPEERYISLSGIVYASKDDWTIWLNGQRVMPDALPKEVLDLKVYEEYVEMKWYDEYSKQILPVRLRPHQRFNIDTRIFLPG